MKTKPSACLSTLKTEFKSLRALDDMNQELFSTSGLKKGQMILLTEAVFFAAFRAYEQFLRNIFLLYCCGIQSNSRKLVRSYLQPRTIKHAEILIKSSMRFLDWSSPDNLIERSEAYLKDGYPIKNSLSMNLETLRDLKKIRNHIAHMSNESTIDFKKVIRSHYGVIPLNLPRPGEYLLLPTRRDPNLYYLRSYMDLIENVTSQMT